MWFVGIIFVSGVARVPSCLRGCRGVANEDVRRRHARYPASPAAFGCLQACPAGKEYACATTLLHFEMLLEEPTLSRWLS